MMLRPQADYTLLFGILAMQMAFIDREQLKRSMGVWVESKDHSLAEIMRQQGMLGSDECELLNE